MQMNGRAAPHFTLDPNGSAGLAHEAVNHAETETGAAADLFGGEERLEDACHDVRRHSNAGVDDGQTYEISKAGISDAVDVHIGRRDVHRFEHEYPTVR